jgi:hypothetical protein
MVNPVRVPTEVKDEAVTPEFRVPPDNVPAAAVTVMSAEPLKETPLMLRAVARVVAVPALPLTEPVIVFVTVRFARVPTDVKDEAVTPEASVVPVRVPAAAVIVIAAVPSKLVPLIARGVARAVAVDALPVRAPVKVVAAIEPVPVMLLVPIARVPPIVRPARVPTEVRDEAVTPEFRVEPVSVPAAAVTVIAAEPSKLVPLIARGVARVVAVEAFPVRAPTKVVDVTEESPATVVVVLPSEMLVLPRLNEPPPVEIVCQPVLSRYFRTFSVESYWIRPVPVVIPLIEVVDRLPIAAP